MSTTTAMTLVIIYIKCSNWCLFKLDTILFVLVGSGKIPEDIEDEVCGDDVATQLPPDEQRKVDKHNAYRASFSNIVLSSEQKKDKE